MATNVGDIELNGVKYRIDLASYKEKDLADFSPRGSVPGGSVNMAELLLYQPLNMTDWRHGFGFLWHTDAMGYMRTYGNMDTRQPGAVMMGSKPQSISDSDNAFKHGLTIFNNLLYSWYDGATHGVRKFSSDNVWSAIYTTNPVHFCLPTADYLFICPEGERLQKMTSTDGISAAGLSSDTGDIWYMAIHNGKIYANPEGTNRLHWGVEPDLSDLDTRAAEDTEHIVVGGGSFPIIKMISYANYLYVFTKEGVYVVGDDNIARKVLDYSSEASTLNFRAVAVYNGYLYFNVGSRMYQYNGSRLTDVTPPRLGDKYPYSEFRYYGAAVTAGNFLYVLSQWYNDETTDTSLAWQEDIQSIISFDGVGWHKIADISYGSTGPVITYCPLAADGNYGLYYSLISGSGVGTWKTTTPWRNVPLAPFDAGLTSDTAPSFKTSRLDMGFRRITKSIPSILVEADNLSTVATESRYLKIDYYIDGNSTNMESFGYVTNNGITELFPNYPSTSDTDLTEEFKNIVLVPRFINAGESTNQTPILEGITVRFLLRPDVFYGYNMNIVAAENYVYGDEQANISVYDIRDNLMTLRDSKAPLNFTDLYGDTHKVYISAVTVMPVERHENSEDGTNNIEAMININLVQAR
ncbi:hypothetical protein IH575_00255 [Candidatus Dojkabacteria bacterium]|nr:hypothetical protein [Candidatus Dojkabacteria bacterium]